MSRPDGHMATRYRSGMKTLRPACALRDEMSSVFLQFKEALDSLTDAGGQRVFPLALSRWVRADLRQEAIDSLLIPRHGLLDVYEVHGHGPALHGLGLPEAVAQTSELLRGLVRPEMFSADDLVDLVDGQVAELIQGLQLFDAMLSLGYTQAPPVLEVHFCDGYRVLALHARTEAGSLIVSSSTLDSHEDYYVSSALASGWEELFVDQCAVDDGEGGRIRLIDRS